MTRGRPAPGGDARAGAHFFASAPAVAALGVAAFGPLELDPAAPRWGHVLPRPSRAGPGPRSARGCGTRSACPSSSRPTSTRRRWPRRAAGPPAGRRPRRLPDRRHRHRARRRHRRPGAARPAAPGGRPPSRPARARRRLRGVCPLHGDCWEGLASGPAVAAALGTDPAALDAGHPAWDLEARYLVAGLASVVLVLAPQRVVLGGGVGRRPEVLAGRPGPVWARRWPASSRGRPPGGPAALVVPPPSRTAPASWARCAWPRGRLPDARPEADADRRHAIRHNANWHDADGYDGAHGRAQPHHEPVPLRRPGAATTPSPTATRRSPSSRPTRATARTSSSSRRGATASRRWSGASRSTSSATTVLVAQVDLMTHADQGEARREARRRRSTRTSPRRCSGPGSGCASFRGPADHADDHRRPRGRLAELQLRGRPPAARTSTRRSSGCSSCPAELAAERGRRVALDPRRVPGGRRHRPRPAEADALGLPGPARGRARLPGQQAPHDASGSSTTSNEPFWRSAKQIELGPDRAASRSRPSSPSGFAATGRRIAPEVVDRSWRRRAATPTRPRSSATSSGRRRRPAQAATARARARAREASCAPSTRTSACSGTGPRRAEGAAAGAGARARAPAVAGLPAPAPAAGRLVDAEGAGGARARRARRRATTAAPGSPSRSWPSGSAPRRSEDGPAAGRLSAAGRRARAGTAGRTAAGSRRPRRARIGEVVDVGAEPVDVVEGLAPCRRRPPPPSAGSP